MRSTKRVALKRAASLTAMAALLVACSATDVMRPAIDVQETAAVAMPSRATLSPPPRYAPPPAPEDPAGFSDTDDQMEVGPMSTPDDATDPDTQDYDIPDAADQRELDQDFSEPAEPKQETVIAAPMETTPSPEKPRRFGLFGFPATPRLDSGMPDSEVQCRKQLRRAGAKFRDLPAIRQGQCGIDHPVELTALAGGVQMKPAATLTCAMALTVARWTKSELVPAARLRYFSGIKAIHQGSSYSCRRIAGSGSLSEHGKGNALDIMRVELNNGKDIGIKKKGLFSFRERGLLNNVRGDACKYFSTVLGPGYNYDHRDHFHFDIASRRNGRVSCH
jgi:hypothetical protein